METEIAGVSVQLIEPDGLGDTVLMASGAPGNWRIWPSVKCFDDPQYAQREYDRIVERLRCYASASQRSS